MQRPGRADSARAASAIWDMPGPGFRMQMEMMKRGDLLELTPALSMVNPAVPFKVGRPQLWMQPQQSPGQSTPAAEPEKAAVPRAFEGSESWKPDAEIERAAIFHDHSRPLLFLNGPATEAVKISSNFEPFDFRSHQTTVVKEAVAEAAGFPGEIVDEVIVPVPSEVFLVLDKLGKPDWKAELRSTKRVAPPQRIDAALLLGMVVAEGFVAVQAQNQEAVENVGRDVLKLAESLGLKDVVQEHCQEILNASKKNHWEIVRVELDKTQKTVRDTMEKRRDQELAHCVSLGGWLRGTEAVTDLITKNYTSDAAELLNQPDIVKHFRKQVGPMGTKSAKLKSIVAGLEEIGHVIGAGDEPPSASGVQTIQGVAARLVKEINTQTQKTK